MLKSPRLRHQTWEIDVPGDNSCLFWAAALTYLIPVKDDDITLRERFGRLFGFDHLEKSFDHVKNFLQSYSPFQASEDAYQNEKLGKLIQRIFRKKVVGHISSKKDDFKEEVYNYMVANP